jgi:hypothetical protein
MIKQLHKVILFVLLLWLCLPLAAQQRLPYITPYDWELSITSGIQMGGAIPIPMSALGDGAVHVSLKVAPLLSARVSKSLSQKWRVYAELGYALSGFTAEARVKNQHIKYIERGEPKEQYFTGVSYIDMSFSYAEFPIYAEYSVSPRNKLLMGLYGACKINGKFETIAEKGFIGENPDMVGAEVHTDIYSYFSNDLRSWDFGVLVGYEFAVFRRLNAGLHVVFSPFDIFKSDSNYFDYTMHPMRGSLSLSYALFRK